MGKLEKVGERLGKVAKSGEKWQKVAKSGEKWRSVANVVLCGFMWLKVDFMRLKVVLCG